MLYKKCTNGQITLLLTLFASFVLGSGIWSSGVITQGDESDYIRSAQEMYRSGDLLTPTLRDEARFTKPPLLYWLLVISYKIFGISLFSSRLPSVLAGVLLSVTMFRFGKYLYGRDAGVLSALLTITSFGMVKFSKIALMEIPLALCILLSFFNFLLYLDSEKKGWLWLSFFFLGLSSLLKSPVYPLIVVFIIALYLVSQNSLGRVLKKETFWGSIVFLSIALPWYLFMLAEHGTLFYSYYVNEHLEKFLVEKHYLFRVWVGLFFYLLPWSFLFLFSVYKLFSEGEFKKRENLFMLIWIGVFLILFLFPNQKGHYYSIPMLPPAMLLTGGVLARTMCKSGSVQVWTSVVLAVLIIVLAAALYLLNHLFQPGPVITILPLLFSFFFITRKMIKKSTVLLGISVAFFYSFVLPSLSVSPLPDSVASKLNSSYGPVFTFRLSPVLFSDLLNKEVNEVREYGQLSDLIIKGGVVIIREVDFDEVKNTGVVLSSWTRWRRRISFSEGVRALSVGDGPLKERVLLVGGELTPVL